jgi:radical SAM superfamily enzyme YgiQ (UPF0313 family)
MPEWLAGRIFPTKSDDNGRMFTAQYGLCKVEASLIEGGFTKDDIIIADPRKIDKVIGEDTKVIGIGCLDPLGICYGAGIVKLAAKMVGYPSDKPSYMSKKFIELINNPLLKKYDPKVILGGQGAWQIVDLDMQEKLGIDCVLEGEGEKVTPKLFKDAIDRKELPKHLAGDIPEIDEIPAIYTPSRGGIVEITRGCGRNCKFCTPNLLRFRTLPKELILEEIRLNLKNGAGHIVLHSEDFLRYGSKGLKPDRDKIIDLLHSIKNIEEFRDDIDLTTDFLSSSSVLQAPDLIEEVSHEFGTDIKKKVIEIGIETGSPNIIRKYMAGKPKPFDAKDWQELVEQSIGILNDNGWIVCGTMITGFPEEKDDDVIKSIKLVEKLAKYDCFLFVLPFISMGGLRKMGSIPVDDYLNDPLRIELIKKGLIKSAETAFLRRKDFSKDLTFTKKMLLNGLLFFVSNFVKYKLS